MLYRLIGLFLVALPFIPLAQLFGVPVSEHTPPDPMQWVLGVLLCTLGGYLLSAIAPTFLFEKLPSFVKNFTEQHVRLCAFILFFFLGLLLYVFSRYGFSHQPLLIDSISQVFQANVFANGDLREVPPRHPEFFFTQNMILDKTGWYSQYPPGHSLLLAIGALLNNVWIIPIILSLATVFFLFRAISKIYDRDTALFSLLLLMGSPFFLTMSASMMNHTSMLFLASLALYLFVRWESDTPKRVLGLGLVLGAGFLVRPLTALCIAVTFFSFVLLNSRKQRTRYFLLTLLAAGIPFFLLLLYNKLTNGSYLLFGYNKLWGSGHGMGFHETPWGSVHTPMRGLRNQLYDLSLLNVHLFGWMIPACLPLGIFLILRPELVRWDKRMIWGVLLIPIAYFFYWHRDTFFGPRLLYCTLLFLVPLSARAWLALIHNYQQKAIHPLGLFRAVSLSGFFYSLLLINLAYGSTIGVYEQLRIVSAKVPSIKADIRQAAAAQGISRGIIFMKVSWGNRLLARMRGLGISAATTEKAYNTFDHCFLELEIQNVEQGIQSVADVTNKLETLLSNSSKTLLGRRTELVNRDPSLRLHPKRTLETSCREEIEYDQSPYTIYAHTLPHNVGYLKNELIIARDLRDKNPILRTMFPKFPAYLYDGSKFSTF